MTKALHWFLLASRLRGDFRHDVMILAFCSLLTTTFFLFIGVATFPGGAYQFGDYTLILGSTAPTYADYSATNLFARDIGYPLLMLATGYQFHHSFIGIILLQAAMAWAMPLLIYRIVGSHYRVIGFWAGIATIFSIAPYIFMKMIHHDQAYIFLSLLTIYLASKYLHTSTTRYLYFGIIALLAASLTRPAGNLLALPLLVIFFVFKPENWRHYVLCAALVASTMLLYAEHRKLLFSSIPDGTSRSYTGRQIFYNLYVNSADFGIRVDEKVGPATAQLFSKARAFIKAKPLQDLNSWYTGHGFPERAKNFWFTRFHDNDDAFFESMIQHPSHDYFEFFCLVEQNDGAFRDAAIEIVKKHPLYPLQFTLRNVALFFWSPGYAHGRFGLSYDSSKINKEGIYFMPFHADLARAQIEAYVPPPGKVELLSREPGWINSVRERAQPIENLWKQSYEIGNQVSFSLAAIALIGLFFGSTALRAAIAISWVFFLYNALVTSAFAEPNYRYHFFQLPTQFILAGFGLGIAVKLAGRILVSAGLPPAFITRIARNIRSTWSLSETSAQIVNLQGDYRVQVAILLVVAATLSVAWGYMVSTQLL